MSAQNNSNEIKHWLRDVLFEEQLTDFTVEILGNTEKGDGYMGDIVFVHVDGRSTNEKKKSFDLVLKCSKKSQVLRDSVPVKETFENEIYMYSRIFPAFKQFEIEKIAIEECFDSVPPYFGQFVSENMEVLGLQNLKVLGYRLHERRQPLDTQHLKLLMREYGKWHAISGAMQDQRPEEFKQLVEGLRDVWKKFGESTDINTLFSKPVGEVHDLIKEDIDENVAQKLLNFKNDIVDINTKLCFDRSHFSVITHGDNWNNNFMFKYEETDPTKPVRVSLLDWQISNFISPVMDLSYCLYASISRKDLENFEDFLKEYYTSFSNHLRKLGSDPDKIFPYSQLLEDWKMFGKFGIMTALLVIKIAISEQDEVQDVVEIMENGGEFGSTFSYEIKNKNKLRERVLPVVEHAAAFGVI